MSDWHTMSNTPASLSIMERRLSLLIEVTHNLGVLRSVARRQTRLATVSGSGVYSLEIHPELKIILDAGKYSKMPNKKH
jgi:hypothetical protein